MTLGFISTHELLLTYNFHNYMLQSMEEEFREIVGIGWSLWIFAIVCMLLNFHGTEIYFWLSFLPAILILMIGTKLHRIVVKLAVEIMDRNPRVEHHQFKLRDELLWFGKPELLLWLIQFISFQNALEMASFLWSMWEVKQISCYTDNHVFAVIRLSFGIVSQFWCSFITPPLYVIVTQMGTNFKKSVVSEDVRNSLSTWHHRVKARQNTSSPTSTLLLRPSPPLDSDIYDLDRRDSTLDSSSGKNRSFVSLAELFASSFQQTSSSH